MQRTTTKGSLAILVAAAMLGGCAPEGLAAEASTEAIVNGTLETGYPSVMLLYNQSGGMCTASLITPRVMLTARHCVMRSDGRTPASASAISFFVGSSQRNITRQYRSRAVHLIPGSSSNIGDGRATDLALVELATPADETPMEFASGSPSVLLGQRITAIGYGQTPSGQSGTKYRTTATVNGVQQGLVFVEPAVCQGDSGGPVIGPDGLIYGVASFIFSPDGRTEPRCGTAPGAYNELFRHMSWIQGVLEMVGDACFPDEGGEVCDGLDNDCNGVADEGCMPLGSECTDSATCIGGLCAATQDGMRCTQECDPMRPDVGCPPGFFCGSTGCAGHCVEGAPGGAPIGAACAEDTDCASLYCADPGDGRQRCLQPCQLDAGRCLGGEICVPLDDSCGGCVPEEIVSGLPHGLGEPCGGDADCRSGMCRERGGLRECVSACGDGATCPRGFSCREEACVRNPGGGIGSACIDNADCGGGICALAGGRSWCTATCADASTCPDGYSCMPAGGTSVCAPDGALVGESCDDDGDCLSGLCARSGGSGFCSETCDADRACGVGFECRRTTDGSASVCRRASGSSSGGCAVSAPGARRGGEGGGAGAVALLGLALALVVARRRR